MQSPETIRLTAFCAGGGCASKVGSADLARALRGVPVAYDDRVLVGYGTSDDAGVYRLSAETAIVQTVDFFTPIVDDPYDFGRIAAANAISDVYAMGGRPITALNICAYPMEKLGHEVLTEILRGGAAVAKAAGVAILGGHTVDDDEPKYGMAVTGLVHPDRTITNAGARPGDVLVLTKPIGTGILAAALKKGEIDADAIAPAIAWMTTLNDVASEAMIEAGAHAATDVTGFGLLGHGGEMARASGVRLHFEASRVPVHALARDLLARGISPGGSRRNAIEHGDFTTFAGALSPDDRLLLSDAQTSGGLLIALPEERAADLIRAIEGRGGMAVRVGTVAEGKGIFVDA